MRKTLVTLAAASGLLMLAPLAASAAPVTAAPRPVAAPGVQLADWYCGPRCEYWRHRRWEHERWEHHRRWEHRRWEEGRYYPYQYRYGWYR
jgi:hypothetical protein